MVKEFGMERADEILERYEESFGSNGVDFLWSLESEDEVYDVLADFI